MEQISENAPIVTAIFLMAAQMKKDAPPELPPTDNTPKLYTFKGKTMTVGQWAKELGCGKCTLKHRINAGWPIDRAFSQPINKWVKQ